VIRNRIARYYETVEQADQPAFRPAAFAACPGFARPMGMPGAGHPASIYQLALAEAQRAARQAEDDSEWFNV
jgi:hypothetical protein